MSNAKTNPSTGPPAVPHRGRLLGLDLGAKRVGVAVTDELRIAIRPLAPISRTSWKKLVRDVAALVRDFDAQSVVIGLPLGPGGRENSASTEVRRRARDLQLSLGLPVFLQDERLTSVEAESELRSSGYASHEVQERVDGEAAALILRDYLGRDPNQG